MADAGDLADALAPMVRDAVQKVLTEHGGGYVLGMCVAVKYIDADGERNWAQFEADGQGLDETLGILQWYTVVTDEAARVNIRQSLEDGD